MFLATQGYMPTSKVCGEGVYSMKQEMKLLTVLIISHVLVAFIWFMAGRETSPNKIIIEPMVTVIVTQVRG